MLPGGTNIFLASPSTLPAGPVVAERLAARLEAGEFTTRLVSPAYVRYLYDNDRFDEIRGRLATMAAPMNTDSRPTCYRHTLVLWLARFFPELNWAEPTADGEGAGLWKHPWVWGLLAGWLVVVFAGRRRRIAGRLQAMAGAAAAAMVLETALILDYQARVGALYQDLGQLLALFMVGLTAGAAGMAALRNRGARPWLRSVLPWAVNRSRLTLSSLRGQWGRPWLTRRALRMPRTSSAVGWGATRRT